MKKRKAISAHARAAKKYRDEHKRLGLCCDCPDSATHGPRCKKHHNRLTKWRRKKNGVKKHYKKKVFGKVV